MRYDLELSLIDINELYGQQFIACHFLTVVELQTVRPFLQPWSIVKGLG